MKRPILPILLLGALLLASGCASSHLRFEGVGPDGRLGGDVHYALQSDAGLEATVMLHARGRRNEPVGSRRTDVVSILLTVDNLGSDEVSLPLADLRLDDDAGRTWRRLSAEGQPDDEEIQVPGHTRATVEVAFDAGAPGALRSTGSVTLDWRYRFRGEERNHRTRFLPSRVRRSRVVYGTSVWFGRGPTWCW